MSVPEFSYPVRLDEIGALPTAHKIAAAPAERAALATRFGIVDVIALEADIAVSREAVGYRATGAVRARAVQSCVVSAEPVEEAIDEAIDVLFVTSLADHEADSETELSARECEIVELDGQAINLGELAAETLALALNPYPRASDDKIAAARRLLVSEEEAEIAEQKAAEARNPFSALKNR